MYIHIYMCIYIYIYIYIYIFVTNLFDFGIDPILRKKLITALKILSATFYEKASDFEAQSGADRIVVTIYNIFNEIWSR